MQIPFWSVGLLMLVIAAWVAFKIRYYMRRSEAEWRRVDKSKLRRYGGDD